jgi:DNA-binding NarL/FixJ family response regulator
MVIACVDDLLFSSKIRAVASHAGARVVFTRSADTTLSALGTHNASLVIIDLDGRSADAIDIIRAIRHESIPQPRIVGFGAHVNVERLRAAVDAGCDQAVARSTFVTMLPGMLEAAAAGTPSS